MPQAAGNEAHSLQNPIRSCGIAKKLANNPQTRQAYICHYLTAQGPQSCGGILGGLERPDIGRHLATPANVKTFIRTNKGEQDGIIPSIPAVQGFAQQMAGQNVM